MGRSERAVGMTFKLGTQTVTICLLTYAVLHFGNAPVIPFHSWQQPKHEGGRAPGLAPRHG